MEKHKGVFLFSATLVFLTMPHTTRCCFGIARHCKSHTECCIKNCQYGICRRPCLDDGKQCHRVDDCCSRFCDKGQCRCRQSGRECTYDSQCCSKICKKSYCGSRLQGSYSSGFVAVYDF